ncbi:MAG: hypothetical protein ABSB01_20675 [Streptosporangiaceae bacterium]
MTADLYAAATGLIERSAAAYVSGAPEDAADDGLFGPASVTWRVSTDLASPVAGLRSLLMQAQARESMAYLLDPSGLDEDVAGFWHDVPDAAVAVLPDWAREMYGRRAPQPLTSGRRTEIRQSLGVLDAVFLGEPGVLEARQRITLRMRIARPA